jgi:hypothetical protein
MANEERCIICGNEAPGLVVREDYVIGAMRWLKRNVTHNEKGYKLVVCKQCYPKYKKSRDSYVRKQVSYLVIGTVFAVLLIGFGRSLGALAAGAIIIVLMYLLSLLSYMPSVVMPTAAQVREQQRRTDGQAIGKTRKG